MSRSTAIIGILVDISSWGIVMFIYFAGSIRAGRSDAQLYYKLVEILKNYGTVLTEHVGNPNLTTAGN